jgi:integrase/recombinase XerD
MVRKLKSYIISWEEVLQHFLLDCKVRNLSPKTVKWYEDSLSLTFEEIGIDYVADIKPGHYQDWILELQDRELSPNTINGRLRALKSFYNYCDGRFEFDNVLKDIKLLKERKTVIKPFSPVQIEKLLRQPNMKSFSGVRDYTMMLLMLDTGIRISELLSIKKEHVNFENNSILILGKGNKERFIPIGTFLKKQLMEWIHQVDDCEYLFITRHEDQLTRRMFHKRLADYGVKAKIEGVRVSPHTFRHTFAMNYLKNGGNIYYLQSILGHSTLVMVQRYLRCIDEDVVTAHNKFSPLDALKKRGR